MTCNTGMSMNKIIIGMIHVKKGMQKSQGISLNNS